MSSRYSHLLSPIKIGNIVLKNRMLSGNAMPHFLQGPETFPTEAVISHFAGVAKNGAAVVTCFTQNVFPRKNLVSDMAHMPMFDVDDPAVQNYFSHVADAIHFYDSKASISLRIKEILAVKMPNFNSTGVIPNRPPEVFLVPPQNELPVQIMKEMIEDFALRAKFFQSLGFDMVNIFMSYGYSVLANSLSPALNKRKDQYGGSIENRARFILELCQAVKKTCGQDFLIEAQISGEDVAGGYTLEDTVKYARIWEGAIDILELRAHDVLASHPVGFNSQKGKPLTLRYAQAIKESGAKIVTAPIGGFQDLDLNEEYITSGKTDMIGMSRAFICDPEYGKKAYEGRGEDVVPCIRCNKCHVISMTGPWYSVCSVNPTLGIAHRVNRMIEPLAAVKKVAVVGGGPAGLKAAIVAAEKGHKVTLYEKTNQLGGQLRHADFASFKWPLRDFKNYLIRQIYKEGVEVLLNTEATPETIRAKRFDAVLVAAGAEPVIPDIPGADGSNVWTPIGIYGKEKSLGKNVVIVGGAQMGTETGIYLAQNGHDVTVLTRHKELAYDATPIHYIEMVRETWEALKNFHFIAEATTTGITRDQVTYTEAAGNQMSIKADSVVVSAGLRPRQEEALKFYGSADRFFIIGDCRAVGNVQECMRTAFATASQL